MASRRHERGERCYAVCWITFGVAIILGLLGLSTPSPAENGPGAVEENADFQIWLANASPVNFGDLTELIVLAPPADENVKTKILRWLHGPDVYEGFFESYQEGVLRIPRTASREPACLTPEAEWVLVFPHPVEAQKKMVEGLWNSLQVELRGMVEGKRLEYLTAESCPPEWKPASRQNNVVTDGGLGPYSLRELGCGILCEGRVCPLDSQTMCAPIEGRIEILSKERRVFTSDVKDLRVLLRRIPGDDPLTRLVKEVFGEFQNSEAAKTGSILKAINFSAVGKHAALVNDEERRAQAERALGLSRFFQAIWDPCLKARVMESLASMALKNPHPPYCLGEELVLVLTGTSFTARLFAE